MRKYTRRLTGLLVFAGLYQEWIELDLFHYGLARFSDAEFDDAGITADVRALLNFFADQETGHAQLLTNVSFSMGCFDPLVF